MRQIVGVFLVKTKYFGKIITIFTFLSITNFKTDRYLNNFQEHLFGILRLIKDPTSLQNFLPT